MAETLKNIALVGASGNLGTATLEALLKNGKHKITVITRPGSKATYPSDVVVKQGNYDDEPFLESAFHGQDVLILMLGFAGLSYQSAMFDAAAKAGVKYIFPSEYGADMYISGTDTASELIRTKLKIHKRIEELGMKWIAVVCNSWVDYCLQYGVFGIFAPERKAEIYIDGVPFNMTTIPKVAAAIAACLALPRSTVDEQFANKCLYVSSFHMTQQQIFQAVLRVTGTTETDWKIERKTVDELIADGQKMIKEGDSAGHFKVLFGGKYKPGKGGDYSAKLHNEFLGLDEEDLDKVVRSAVDAAKPGGWEAGSSLELKKY